jgi:hypothetical protein
VAAARRLKRRPPPYSTGWGQIVEEGGTAPDGANPAMEGTSGAAEHATLRGAACEAALKGERRFGNEARSSGRHVNGASVTKLRRGRKLQPATPRVRDRRCPGRSGWGKAPVASDRKGRRTRQCGATRTRASSPWPVKSRLAALQRPATERKPSIWNQRSHPRKELCRWATTGAVRGVRTVRWSCS